MGQYHIPVNLTKREFFSPHSLGDGLKMLEQTNNWTFGGTLHALYALLTCSHGRGGGDLPDGRQYVSGGPPDYEGHYRDLPGRASAEFVLGRWAGDNVVVAGDYSQSEDIDHEFPIQLAYSLCGSRHEVESTIAYLRENGRTDEADLMTDIGPFTDISSHVRDYFATLCRVTYEGDGWATRTRTQKKMI